MTPAVLPVRHRVAGPAPMAPVVRRGSPDRKLLNGLNRSALGATLLRHGSESYEAAPASRHAPARLSGWNTAPGHALPAPRRRPHLPVRQLGSTGGAACGRERPAAGPRGPWTGWESDRPLIPSEAAALLRQRPWLRWLTIELRYAAPPSARVCASALTLPHCMGSSMATGVRRAAAVRRKEQRADADGTTCGVLESHEKGGAARLERRAALIAPPRSE